MKALRISKVFPFIIALPAISIGSITMYKNDIQMNIWSQNIFGLLIIGLLIGFLSHRKLKIERVSIPIMILLILISFLDPGLDNVHRWISVGPIKFYISSIVLPILIIRLWEISEKVDLWVLTVITFGISILLAIQPDASQITAFIIPMVIIIFSKTKNNYFRYSVLCFFLLLIVYSWIFLDNLPPVAYVEGIIKMTSNLGIVWLGLSIIALAILPLPFILSPPRNAELISVCLGIYFVIILMSTQFGNFPVPLMGYGISPILGYYLAITWFIKAKTRCS